MCNNTPDGLVKQSSEMNDVLSDDDDDEDDFPANQAFGGLATKSTFKNNTTGFVGFDREAGYPDEISE